MARDVLAVPARSVSVEGLFIAACNVCPYWQGNLKPTMVRNLVMLRHYVAAELTLMKLEDQEAESLEPDSCYSYHNIHWAFETAHQLAEFWCKASCQVDRQLAVNDNGNKDLPTVINVIVGSNNNNTNNVPAASAPHKSNGSPHKHMAAKLPMQE
jgi:hypothetical protein